ncbi:hypothetical protein VPNG_09750 [Cytospora leucostoma]|uniref:Uncharacterized protein n=1 Tax=Cytospora leucostoma TaxID=1230097 RepID=A0A423VLZ4_9PEZI|nr:hypothetical protein VPNG_09750 [Cytospora leucostoma]
MASETSFDLASVETQRSYNEVVQHVRRVLEEHLPGLRCKIAKDTFPPLPVKFDVREPYDASKGGAPEHIRAMREAAVREEGRMQEEGDTAPSSAQNEPIRAIVPAQAQQVRFSDTRDSQQRVPGLLVKDADVTFMKGLWEMYNLGATWALQGELQPWEVKIVASSGSLFFGPEFCHKDRIIDFMAAKGPGKIYTRRLRDDWLVVGLTIPKNHRWGLEKKTASLAELLDSLEGVYGSHSQRQWTSIRCGYRVLREG